MRLRSRNCGWLLLLVLNRAAPAVAEVMDKEPSLRDIWRSAVPLAALAFAAGRLHPLLGLVFLFVPTRPLIILSETQDPFVGPAIRAEAGMGYVLQVYAANGLLLFSYLIGVLLWRRQGR